MPHKGHIHYTRADRTKIIPTISHKHNLLILYPFLLLFFHKITDDLGLAHVWPAHFAPVSELVGFNEQVIFLKMSWICVNTFKNIPDLLVLQDGVDKIGVGVAGNDASGLVLFQHIEYLHESFCEWSLGHHLLYLFLCNILLVKVVKHDLHE